MASLAHEQEMISPKIGKATLRKSTAMDCDVSPTGIIGFADADAGTTTAVSGRKYVQPSEGLPSLDGLYFSVEDDDMSADEMNRRFSNTKKYWDTVEDELVSGRKEYLIPRCEQPWQGFTVPQGHVQHCADQWKLSMRPSLSPLGSSSTTTPLSPLPGINVRRLVTLSEERAQQAWHQQEAGEPYLVYKHMSPEMHKRVEQVENVLLALQKNHHVASSAQDDPPTYRSIVLKHVDPSIQSMVDYWNTKVTWQAEDDMPFLQRPLKHASTHISTMVYWMQKQFESSGLFVRNKKEATTTTLLPHDVVGQWLVWPMIQLWESLNYHFKTGLVLTDDKVVLPPAATPAHPTVALQLCLERKVAVSNTNEKETNEPVSSISGKEQGEQLSHPMSEEKPNESAASMSIEQQIAQLPVPPLPETLDSVPGIHFVDYPDESQLDAVMNLVGRDLSEPYSIFTYRYFLYRFPQLCILAIDDETQEPIGCVVGKIDQEEVILLDQEEARGKELTGYIGMLAVSESFRRRGIGKALVRLVLQRMKALQCVSVTLETEVTNKTAQKLYQDCFGFLREELLLRYYLNWNDAYRLRLWFK